MNIKALLATIGCAILFISVMTLAILYPLEAAFIITAICISFLAIIFLAILIGIYNHFCEKFS